MTVKQKGDFSPPVEASWLIDFLTTDQRASFILRLRPPERPEVVFTNLAAQRLVTSFSQDDFAAWIEKLPEGGYAVVCALQETIQEEPHTTESVETNNYDDEDQTRWVLDWTRFPCAAVNDWTKFLRSIAWEKTAIGPMESWPTQLRQLLVMCMACDEPRSVCWGENNILFFNAAAVPIVGQKMKESLGFPTVQLVGQEFFSQTRSIVHQTLVAGKSTRLRRMRYTYNPYGRDQDMYYDMTLIPISSDTGYFHGHVAEFVDVTSIVIQDYRRGLSSTLLESVTMATSSDELWFTLRKVFDEAQAYVPYALIYVRDDASSLEASNFRLQELVGAVGALVPSSMTITSREGDTELTQAFVQSLTSEEISILQLADGTLPRIFVAERQSKPKVDAACILPIPGGNRQNPLAFIVLGINPQQPFVKDDTDLMAFIRDTVSQSVSIMLMPPNQSNDGGRAATISRMAEQLRVLTSERNKDAFATLARDAPCGMFIVNNDGYPRFLNRTWLEMAGFTSLKQVQEISRTRSFWADVLSEEDFKAQEKAAAGSIVMETLTKGVALRTEHRFIFPPDPSNPDAPRLFNRWVECVTLPEFDSSRRVQGIMGFIIDITDRKKREEHERQVALDNKAAADRFIDTICHELRNPLSAVLQLADSAMPSIESLNVAPDIAEATDVVLDALKTIVLCAQHMKTIVDDILTLSKLDSNFLTLAQEQSSPIELARKALKIYEAECRNVQINTRLEIDDEFEALNVDYVIMDQGRVLQVLMNLISNAVKFTRSSATREIIVRLAAHTKTPNQSQKDINFAPLEKGVGEPTALQIAADVMYLQYTVTDTGRGITREELQRLFQRFSQGSAKTYSQYGGSGLGLFISKKLSELHGGQIGVRSDGLGLGSTFTFYIKVSLPAPHSEILSIRRDSVPNTMPIIHEHHLDILIVEDNLVNQTVMAKQLRKLKHNVYVANHGQEALDFLSRTELHQQTLKSDPAGAIPLSIILMDVEMPIMDGLTCTRRIREMQNDGRLIKHIPIVAITANARDQHVQRALESGVDDVITKPFRLPSLLAAIRKLFEKHDGV